jgi:CRP/FNR family cyclic AMP-dependent transcriptional regulator
MLHSELLAQIPLFDTLAAEDLEALAGRMTERHYKASEKVFDKNDQGSSMYIVLSGAVQIFLPGATPEEPPVVLKDARTGEYFGELSLFDDKPRSASVAATVDTTLLELTRVDFSDHLSKSKNAAMTILAEMAERLRETNALLSQRAARDVVKEFEENLTWGQKLADKVAELNGSWAFILFLLAITLLWAAANKFLPKAFDEYPYQFYNLALAILVALQGPLIVMSQNRQTSKDRATAETDFRVNLKNEVGIETLIREVGAMRAETNKRFEVLERSMRGDRIRAEIPIKKPGGPLGPS